MTRKKWHGIVLHHSAGSDTGGCETTRYKEWHTQGRGWLDIGYHAVVEQLDGAYHVVAGRPLNMPGAHCPGKNRDSLGVCLAGDFTHEPPDPRQLVVAARYVAGLCAALAIDPGRITAHKDHSQTACPGQLDVPAFRGMVIAYLMDATLGLAPPATKFPLSLWERGPGDES